MEIKLVNADINPVYVEYQNSTVLLQPGESSSYTACGRFDFKLKHLKPDINNPVMYMADALISYKQSRIIFTVDGEYSFRTEDENVTLKFKPYEYVRSKNISYDVFVFNCHPEHIACTKYEVPGREAILKKCRLLYLLGGLKTLFPISLLIFILSLSCIISEIDWRENVFFAIASGVSSMLLGVSYLRSLRILREYSDEANIRTYMDSPREEYRTLEDDMVQKNLDSTSSGERYW